MTAEASTKGRPRTGRKRGGRGIRQGWILKINRSRRGSGGARYNTALGIVNLKAEGGVPKKAFLTSGQEVGIGMHAAVNTDRFEAHSKIGDVQPIGLTYDMFPKLEANDTRAKDRDIIPICHADKSVREWCHGFKIAPVSRQTKITAGVNAKEILRRGRNCMGPALEKAGGERQGRRGG